MPVLRMGGACCLLSFASGGLGGHWLCGRGGILGLGVDELICHERICFLEVRTHTHTHTHTHAYTYKTKPTRLLLN